MKNKILDDAIIIGIPKPKYIVREYNPNEKRGPAIKTKGYEMAMELLTTMKLKEKRKVVVDSNVSSFKTTISRNSKRMNKKFSLKHIEENSFSVTRLI